MPLARHKKSLLIVAGVVTAGGGAAIAARYAPAEPTDAERLEAATERFAECWVDGDLACIEGFAVPGDAERVGMNAAQASAFTEEMLVNRLHIVTGDSERVWLVSPGDYTYPGKNPSPNNTYEFHGHFETDRVPEGKIAFHFDLVDGEPRIENFYTILWVINAAEQGVKDGQYKFGPEKIYNFCDVAEREGDLLHAQFGMVGPYLAVERDRPVEVLPWAEYAEQRRAYMESMHPRTPSP